MEKDKNKPIEIRGNWKILSKELKYENKYGLRVEEHKVIRPDGKPGIYGNVEARSGIYAAPVDENGDVYLVDSFIYNWNRRALGCITGGIEPGENKEDCVNREMLEEAGVVAKRIDPILKFQPFDVLQSYQEAFLARDLNQETPMPEGSEEIKVVKMPFKKAMGEIGKRIIEGASQTVLYTAREVMKKEVKSKIRRKIELSPLDKYIESI